MPTNQHRNHFFFLVLGVTTLLSLLLAWPYIGALMASLVAAMLLHPFFKRIKKHAHLGNGLSTFITIFLALLVILIPLISLTATLASQAFHLQQNLARSYNQKTIERLSQELNVYLDTLPYGNLQIDATAVLQAGQSVAQSLGNWFFSSAVSLTNSTVTFIINFVIFCVVTISLLPNLDRLKRYVVRLSPLDKPITQRYLKTGQTMMNNMIKGTFLIAFIQGTLAGLMLWYFQVPMTLLLTAVMTILAIIPYMGTAFVMIPVALVFLINGDPTTAIIILTYQFLVVSTIDNLLRPMLTSAQTKLHPAIMLIAILGGMKLFGPFLGLFYGPIVAILFLTSLEIYQENHG